MQNILIIHNLVNDNTIARALYESNILITCFLEFEALYEYSHFAECRSIS